jgi:hypothetical protein
MNLISTNFLKRRNGSSNKEILSPKQVVRNFCFDCVGRMSWEDVDTCEGLFANKTKMCPFHKFRLKKSGRIPAKTFRLFCLQCMGNSAAFVRECSTTNCMIHPYRMGKNPSLMGRINKTSFQNVPK